MDYPRRTKVESIFDLIDHGVDSEVLEHAEKTELAYLIEFEEEAMEFLKNGDRFMGVSTGYPLIDRVMGSFLPGELWTVGGDTGHGKSLFAMNIAQNVYRQTQKPVLMVNLELTRNQAVQRFYNLSGAEHDYAGIMIQRASAVTYQDIDVLMKKAKNEGVCLVVIDHLHFFSRSAKDPVNELSRIMKHFKECAVENDLPVMLLSHVTPTRIMDQEGNVKKTIKPGLHNFKGSSSIEQDSDMVAFVYRDDEFPKQVQVYFKKNRSRPLDTTPVYFNQKEWLLEEDPIWSSKNSSPSGESYEQKDLPSFRSDSPEPTQKPLALDTAT